MSKKADYLTLLSKTYDEAVAFLLEKYGPAEDDYFREQSYERFLQGEIQHITRGNYSRSSEGLECHHIAEDQFLNMANTDYIKEQNIPFEYHTKDRLVFADVIEHAILHVLIAKETSLQFGVPGYLIYLRQKIQQWYINQSVPTKSQHQIACYEKAYVSPQEAAKLLYVMDQIIISLHEE